jgi:hypothetical protein
MQGTGIVTIAHDTPHPPFLLVWDAIVGQTRKSNAEGIVVCAHGLPEVVKFPIHEPGWR